MTNKQDHIYLYDGSWEGLLSAFYHACKAKERSPEISCEQNGGLFNEYLRIHADDQIAREVSGAIVQRISRNSLYRAGLLYLSECDGFGGVMYRYLLLGFSMGKQVDFYQSHEAVRAAHALSRKVVCEAHRFMGLTRFANTENNVYYAAIEPQHNIVPVIAPHFYDRMGGEPWIIHDLKRGIAALSTESGYEILPFTIEYQPGMADDENFFQGLWRRYYKTVSIAPKKNLRLRNRYIPPRYFSHLTELNSNSQEDFNQQ